MDAGCADFQTSPWSLCHLSFPSSWLCSGKGPSYLQVHAIPEWLGLERTLKPISFQPSAMGRDTFH